ncbi:hypothetical protein CKO43_17900 [Rubrivivax gelatinosus]|uniref:Helix-turn-helix domain-containing protein n=1 Tax=Rubrivivax gelatinosus TaxID=28068 RepID=A0ABS1DY26_RUBGE|nr:hypothetical protein [Rubrivivax gelatinosus]
MLEPLLVDEHTLAAAIGMSVAWLRADRRGKRLVPVVRLGSAVRYSPSAVRAALAARQEGGGR